MQLKAYLEYFDMEQIHILALEELQDQPLRELNSIFKFLGLHQMQDEQVFEFKTNMAETKGIPTVIKRKLIIRSVAKVSPSLAEKMASYWSAWFFKHLSEKPVIDEKEKEQLKRELKDDINEFRRLTHKSFDKWEI